MNATMNNLPAEMICHVLDYLSLAELVEKKLVCKLWNELISSQLKVTRLFVEPYPEKKSRWWHVNRLVDEYLEMADPNLFVTQLHRPILRHLRYLRLHLYHELDDLNLNDLSKFSQLVHLDVDLVIDESTIKIEWNLPNLQILKVHLATEEDQQCKIPVSIDCPRLKVLGYAYIGEHVLFDLKSPETITTLSADLHGAKLAPLKNIEIYKYDGQLRFANAIIEQLPKLKVLELNKGIENFRSELQNEEPEIKEFLKELLADRRKALRSDLRLFFAGVEITDETLVDHLNLHMVQHCEILSQTLSSEHLYFGNYPADCQPNLQEELEFVETVSYNILMSLVSEIPKDFFKRFFNIKSVDTKGKIHDPEHFAGFLKSLSYLEFLGMTYPSLEQKWYDRLPAICNVLNFAVEEDKTIELNFDFLARFEPHVRMVHTNGEFRLNSARSLPNLLKSFRIWFSRSFHINFRGADTLIMLRRSHSEDSEHSDQSDDSDMSNVKLDGFYDVLVGVELRLERANSMEVVDFFEELEKELSEHDDSAK